MNVLHLKLLVQVMPWEQRPTGCVRRTSTPRSPSGRAREGSVTSSALTSSSTRGTWETSTSVSPALANSQGSPGSGLVAEPHAL